MRFLRVKKITSTNNPFDGQYESIRVLFDTSKLAIKTYYKTFKFHRFFKKTVNLNGCVFLAPIEIVWYSKVMIPKFIKYLPSKNVKYRFDFEIGYLSKSPCKECALRRDFPGCENDCQTLDKIHTILSEVVSCSRRS